MKKIYLLFILVSPVVFSQKEISSIYEKQTNHETAKKPLKTVIQKSTPIWGAGAVTGGDDGEFNGGLLGWSANSIFDNSGTPGNALWIYSSIGASQGAYSDGIPITSPSVTNGCALFDSDYLDNNGVQGAFGSGISPSPHKGELISPLIDLSGYTDEGLSVNFYCKWRSYLVDAFTVEFSVDNGATWSTIDINDLLPSATNVENEGWVNALFINETTGVSDLTQCRIKFSFEGDYYFALIDDISISLAAPYDLTIGVGNMDGSNFNDLGDQVHITSNRYLPISHFSDGHHGFFGATVKNLGYENIVSSDNCQIILNVEKDVSGVWTSVYTDSLVIDSLSGQGYSYGIQYLSDVSWITVGDFRSTYTATSNLNESTTDNNSTEHLFTITENDYISKVAKDSIGEPLSTRAIFPGGGPFLNFEYGSVFYIEDNTEEITIDSLSAKLYLPNSYVGPTNYTLLANVYEVDASQSAVVESSTLTQYGVGIIELNGLGTTIPNGSYFTGKVNGIGDPFAGGAVSFQGGKHYYISISHMPGAVVFTGEDVPWFGASEQKNYNHNTSMTAIDTLINPSPCIIEDATGAQSFYWTGFGSDVVPSIGIYITSSACIPANVMAGFSADVSGLSVNFTDTSLSSGLIDFWEWDFGDGSTASIQNPTYTYSAGGTYNVCLIVGDSCYADTICTDVSISTVSEQDNWMDDLTVYPVPANNELTITGLKNSGVAIELINALGQVLISKSNQNSETMVLDVQRVESGFYQLKISNENMTRTKSILILK